MLEEYKHALYCHHSRTYELIKELDVIRVSVRKLTDLTKAIEKEYKTPHEDDR